MKNRAIAMLLLAGSCLLLSGCGGSVGELRTDREVYQPGEQITVTFKAPGSCKDSAWVGIVPTEVGHGSEAINDSHDVGYQYLQGRREGTLTFAAPSKSGFYDFRMNNRDDDGDEVCFVTFSVVEQQITDNIVSLVLPKREFAPGELIRVAYRTPSSFTSSAWVGIIPSEVPHGSEAVNDQNDISYQYLSGKTSGDAVLYAPETPGSYDVRIHDSDSDGRETFYVTFTVKAADEPADVTLGEVIEENEG